MSDLTMTIKEMVEKYGSGATLRDKIPTSLPYIFDFDFPIYDESYRTVLEAKIVKRFLLREICNADEEIWKIQIDGKLNEIMPFYNKMYETALLQIDPLYNYKMETERSGSNTGTTQNETNGTKSGSEVDNGNTKTKVTDEHNNSNANNTQNVTNSNHNTTDSSSNNETHTSNTVNTAETNGSSETKNSANGKSNTLFKENDTPGGKISSLTEGYVSKVNETDVTTNDDSLSVNTDKSNNTSTTEFEDKVNSNNSHSISGIDRVDDTTIQTSQDNYNGESDSDTTNHNERAISDITHSKTDGTSISTEHYLEKVSGFTGVSQSKLLTEYRETFINIDEMILSDLNELFILTF